MAEAKTFNLYFQQGVNRLIDFILDLTSAEETQSVLICEINCESGGIPRFTGSAPTVKNLIPRLGCPERPQCRVQ